MLLAVEGETLEGGFGAAGGTDVGEARDAVDDGGAAVEVGGFVGVAVGEGFGGGFGEGVGDGEEGVCVGVGEGVVDVFLEGGCGLGLEWEDGYQIGVESLRQSVSGRSAQSLRWSHRGMGRLISGTDALRMS